PDHLKNQVEGAMLMGLGGALFEAIEFSDGKIINPRFSDYRVPRFSDTPELEVVYDIGTILLQDQSFAAAAARFEAALKIRPDWAEAHNNLGIALASQGRIAHALRHFEPAVAPKPS